MDLTIERRPRSRGVTQLMYVGDDDAVENAVGSSKWKVAAVIAGIAAASSKGTTRKVAAGIALLAVFKAISRGG